MDPTDHMDPENYVGKTIEDIHITEYIQNSQLKPSEGPVDVHTLTIAMPWSFNGTVEYMGKSRKYVLEGFGNYPFVEGISGMFVVTDKTKILSVIEDLMDG